MGFMMFWDIKALSPQSNSPQKEIILRQAVRTKWYTSGKPILMRLMSSLVLEQVEAPKKDSKVKYSIETPCEDVVNENIENKPASNPPMPNEADQHILTEKNKNKASLASEPSEGAKLNSKMDMIMKTLVLLDKRLTLVEDQLRKQNQANGK